MSKQSHPDLSAYGFRCLREPKGGPDMMLVGTPDCLDVIYKAADILSVQGYTVRLCEPDEQQNAESNRVFSDLAYVFIRRADGKTQDAHTYVCTGESTDAVHVARALLQQYQQFKK